MHSRTRTLCRSALMVALLGAGVALGSACGEDDEIDIARRGEDRPMAPDRGDPETRGGDPVGSGALRPDVAAPPPGGEQTPGGLEGARFRDHRNEVNVVIREVAGVPMLVPSAIVVTEETRSLRVRNRGATDRSFSVVGVSGETRVPAGQEVTVPLDTIEPAAIYSVVLTDAAAARAAQGTDPGASGQGATPQTEGESTPDVAAPGTTEETGGGSPPDVAAPGTAQPDVGAPGATAPDVGAGAAGTQAGSEASDERIDATLIVLPSRTGSDLGETGSSGLQP